MGMISTFFRTPKHKRFEYKPMYYDAVKERQKKRFAELEREKQLQEQTGGTYQRQDLKGAFRSQHEETAKIKHRSNGRLVIILAALLLMAYYLLYK